MNLTDTSLAAVRRTLIAELKNAKVENHVREADLILIRLLDSTRSTILGHPETILSENRIGSIREAARRRANGEPLQYILGETFFYGLRFETSPGVLIPRPETERLVELGLDYLSPSLPQAFLDWGTGSGCIAIALLSERPQATALAAEKNPASLSQAWKNIELYGLHSRCLLWHSQNPKDIPVAEGTLDLVVSNPPYIPTEDIESLMRDVRDYEPRLALDGGEDGMDCYRLLFRFAPGWLKPGGVLLLEIGDALQAEKMRTATFDGFTLLKEARDLNGHPRCMAWEYGAFRPDRISSGRTSIDEGKIHLLPIMM